MPQLYPLKFNPIFKEKLWGGQKIKTVLGKDFGDLDNCGETWELSGVKENISIISNGVFAGKNLAALITEYTSELLGEKVYKHFGEEFPLLIKFIDAAQDLSIQVHPDDQLAKERHNCHGKSEMWYVIQADNDARLINGFNRDTNKEEYQQLLNSGRLNEILNVENVSAGESFYLPGGRIHTIGKGLLIAEIQENSDITYRIYDFDRIDKAGNKRILHTELSLDAIDYRKPNQVKSPYSKTPNQVNPIVSTPYFTTNKLMVTQRMTIDRLSLDCFKIYIGVGGSGKIAQESISLGEVLLIPACIKEYDIEPFGELELLETYVEL